MPLLRERLYAKSPFARQFVISWISVLDMVPDIDLVCYLPDLLDGLFRILDDPMVEVKRMCETTLGEFLRSIKNDPSRVDFAGMINILINHAQEKSDDLVQVFMKLKKVEASYCLLYYFQVYCYNLDQGIRTTIWTSNFATFVRNFDFGVTLSGLRYGG